MASQRSSGREMSARCTSWPARFVRVQFKLTVDWRWIRQCPSAAISRAAGDVNSARLELKRFWRQRPLSSAFERVASGGGLGPKDTGNNVAFGVGAFLIAQFNARHLGRRNGDNAPERR